MSFDSKISNWIKGLQNPEEIFRRAVLENEAEILDLNTAQLERGEDSFGNLLDEYASDTYAQFKQALGSKAPLGIPDLKLEGDFYSGFVLKYDGAAFFITSTDEKKDRLKDKYGEDVFGLQEKSIFDIGPDLLRSYLRITRKLVG